MPVKVRVVASRGSGRGTGRRCRLGTNWAAARSIGMRAADEATEKIAEQVPVWDAVVQPLEAINAAARGAEGALAMIAAGPEGSLMQVPEMYMQKVIVAGRAAAAVDLDASVGDNIRGVAKALGLDTSETRGGRTGPASSRGTGRPGPGGGCPAQAHRRRRHLRRHRSRPAGERRAHDHRHRGVGGRRAGGGRAALPRRRDPRRASGRYRATRWSR